MIDLSIVIVNWDTKQLLDRCLGSVFGETRDISLEVIVVDNGSVNGSQYMVARAFFLR